MGADVITADIDVFTLAQLSLLGSLLAGGIVAAVVAFFMFRHRIKNLRREVKKYRRDGATLGNRLATYDIFLQVSGQCLVIFDATAGEPWLAGNLPQGNTIPDQEAAFIDFQSWLPPLAAQQFFTLFKALQRDCVPFETVLDVSKDDSLHCSGHLCGAKLVLCFRRAAETEADYARREARADAMESRFATIQALLDEIKEPIWMRGQDGAISWGNRAYFRTSGPDQQLLSPMQRDKIASVHAKGDVYRGKALVIVDGERRDYAVTAVAGREAQAAIAIDTTQTQALEQALQHNIRAYMSIFDQLSTAVAIFDANMRLSFYNQSFTSLWPLDVAFLESTPNHALLLDRLREMKIVPEIPHWRQWKEELFAAYRAVEPQQHIWNLSDGRTLRIVAHPAPQGGVIWLYEDLSEQLALEARYNGLIRMQGETLDHLREGVAVFGADGQMRLANPAFADLWQLPVDLAVEGSHIGRLEEFCSAMTTRGQDWRAIAAHITGFAEAREEIAGRMELYGGNKTLDYALVPLPQGQSMLTFVDVSASVQVASALQARNEALESADRLRNDFVSHVSYELRTPLTNIIGFADLLRTPAFGPLNERQRDYLQHISAQSGELLHLVNDILDLATVDAGIMELDISEVNVREVMDKAAARLGNRLDEKNLRLETLIAPGLVHFQADGARLRQILFNLLSNAANFSPPNSLIRFCAAVEAGDIIFQITDEGAGIPPQLLDTVFKRFAAHAHHGGRPGAGLGLAIVKSFVELHHGQVDIATGETGGTTVTCRFPADATALRHAAE